MKRFSFQRNLVGRMLLQRIQRHISQSHCKYYLASGLFVAPHRDSPYWIVERTLVCMEDEFQAAKRRKLKRAA
jgi:hypothetical protein